MHWYIKALKKYAVFNGRASRKEFWYFFLFHTIFMTVFIVSIYATGTVTPGKGVGLLNGLYFLYFLATIIPSYAVSVRRLHDIDRSGWWVLIVLIPFVGIVLLVWAAQDSSPGENRFGQNPKEGIDEP